MPVVFLFTLLSRVMSVHELYMHRCLQLAEKAKGNTNPNPMVGALLVHGDKIIGEGWHQQYGQAHAEVNCIESVSAEDRDLIPESTMYVSLEPCAHYGKTPPCALRLIQEKVKNVIVCNDDPFEKVSGRGYDLLAKAGIALETGILKERGLWLNRRFFHFHKQQRPYIILKWAQTRSGIFAPSERSRMQLSSKASQQLVHQWRTQEAAILVGTQTALQDNPQLTARLWQGTQPLRIVIDKNRQLPKSLHVFDNTVSTWILNEDKDETINNTHYIRINFNEDVLSQLMKLLYKAHILSLIVEGGAATLQTFIQQGLWDEARIFYTPDVLSNGIKAPRLDNINAIRYSQMGPDELSIYTNKDNEFHYIEGMNL